MPGSDSVFSWLALSKLFLFLTLLSLPPTFFVPVL